VAERLHLGAQLFADDRQLFEGLQDLVKRHLPLNQRRRRRPDQLEFPGNRRQFSRAFITKSAHRDRLARERGCVFQMAAAVEQTPPIRH